MTIKYLESYSDSFCGKVATQQIVECCGEYFHQFCYSLFDTICCSLQTVMKMALHKENCFINTMKTQPQILFCLRQQSFAKINFAHLSFTATKISFVFIQKLLQLVKCCAKCTRKNLFAKHHEQALHSVCVLCQLHRFVGISLFANSV